MEKIFQLAILFKTIDQATRPIREIQKATQALQETVEKTASKFSQFKEKIEGFEKKALSIEGLVSTTAWVGASKTILGSFMELEDASLRLKSTFMEAGGVVPEVFTKIDEEAKKLGAELPGTTADFYRLAAVMRQLGVEGDILASGGLKAAAYLGAVLNIPYEVAGEHVAKYAQALGIAGEDLVKFIDIIQRLGHLGVKPSEMAYAFGKLSGTLKLLGWQGLETAKELSPIIAKFIQMNLSGETVGTNLSRIFTQMLNPKKLHEFTSSLAQFGIKLELIDEKTGKLKGPAHLIAEFNKIKEAYEKGIISQTKLYEIVSKLAGEEGEDLHMLMTIILEGAESYNKMSDAIRKQANLQQRIGVITNSLRNVWEAFTGTLQNVFAIVGSTLAPTLKKIADFLNDLADNIGQFLEKHKTLASIIGWSIGGFAIFTVGIMATAGAIAAIMFPLKTFIWILGTLGPLMRGAGIATGFFRNHLLHALPAIWAKIKALTILSAQMARMAFTGLISGLKSVILAVRALSIAFFTSPIGWFALGIITLIGAVYLLWKHWDTVSKWLAKALSWLKSSWDAVIKWLAKALSWLKSSWDAVIKWLAKAWDWLKSSWQKVLEVLININPFFALFKALNQLVKHVLGIDLFTAGKKIVESLWKGIESLAMKPVEAMKNIVQKIRNLLPFSPAKEGPLADLHKIKLIETLTEGINSAPLIYAMTKALEPVRAITQPLFSPTLRLPVPAIPGASASPISIHITQNITLQHGSISEKEKEAIAIDLKRAIERALEQINWDKTRRAY
jgi:TP901 family phage tail tape measure protein